MECGGFPQRGFQTRLNSRQRRMDRKFFSAITTRTVRTRHMHHGKTAVLCFFLLFSSSAWSDVFIQWGTTPLPPVISLGVNNVVFSWQPGFPASLLARARKQGYRVYLEAPLAQAAAAAEQGAKAGCLGIILNFPESERTKAQTVADSLRSAYPKLTFMVLGLT